MRTNNKGVTPSVAETVQTRIDEALMEVNVSMPGKIVKYDKKTQFADVQPQLKFSTEDGTVLPFPIIPNVPVKHPRANGGKIFIHLPLKPGDDVQLVFSQRSLDNWKTQGGMSDPADRRKHHITDAVAYVGGSAEPDAFTPKTDNAIEIVNDKSRLNVFPDGTYNLFGGNGDDFIQVVKDLILGIQRATTETWDGPEPLVDPEDIGWLIIQERCEAFVNGDDPYMGI